MTSSDPAFWDIEKAAESLRDGTCSSVELTELMLARIAEHNETLNAFITVTEELAMEAAREADRMLAKRKNRGLLQGIPIAIKDLVDVAGVRNTFGTKLFADNVAKTDASIVERLKLGGAVIIGKTNLHEFATGTTSTNPFYGPVRNPWNTDCYAGGSSGGSAAAVAAGLCFAAIGSDTGCSIRQPAHLCNLHGMKPTFGGVAKDGAFPVSWSMDHLGPLARSALDAAIVMAVIGGPDYRDPATKDIYIERRLEYIDEGIRGFRIGVPQDYFMDNCEPDIAAGFEIGLKVFEALGAKVQPVKLPDMNVARAAGHTLIFTEFHAAYVDRAREDPEKFSDLNRAFVELGGLFSARHLIQAQRARQRLTHQTLEAMRELHAIVMPTCPVVTAPIEPLTGNEAILHTQNTIPFDTVSFPASSVPAGFDRNGLPFGLQIVGQPHVETTVFRVAYAFEQATGHHAMRPPGF